MAYLPNYGDIWYHHKALTNILSLYLVTKKYHVQYDSKLHDVFLVTKPNGETIEFKPSPTGLYYHDTRIRSIVMLNTEAENKSLYSQQ